MTTDEEDSSQPVEQAASNAAPQVVDEPALGSDWWGESQPK